MKRLFLAFWLAAASSGLWAQTDTINYTTPQAGFTFNHTLPKLYTIQTARVLNPLDLSIILGGAFGFERDNGFLGSVAFGLGGYGDIEMATSSLMASLFSRDENYGNIALKGKLYTADDRSWQLSAGMRSNSSWEGSSSDEEAIRTSAEDLYLLGLRYVDYKWRMTSLYLSFTYAKYKDVELHGGLTITDIRYKDAQLYFTNAVWNYNPVTVKQNMVNFFFGFDRRLNERTTMIAEVLSTPVIAVDAKNTKFVVERRYSGSVGLRLFVNRYFVLDTALRYQDDFSGIADTQVRVGVMAMWNAAGH
ncbi:MAG: hypothetical protein FMNOHCHN_00015 [Ignavibacteriaceae bacterium]|nr:hypothetical protein [Ignavibacteriaceae bacterium]MCK6613719.1 hypothetical protein [Ignavibacteriaceae bacterium]